MSYNSKRTIASMVAGVLLIAAYIIYAFGEHAPASEDLKSWAIAMLVFIGISVVAIATVQVIFHIVSTIVTAPRECGHGDKNIERKLSSLMVEDERDKLIRLKSAHIGYVFAGTGFVAALVGLACGMSSIIALHVIFGTLAIGSVAEGIATIYFYENGVRNG